MGKKFSLPVFVDNLFWGVEGRAPFRTTVFEPSPPKTGKADHACTQKQHAERLEPFGRFCRRFGQGRLLLLWWIQPAWDCQFESWISHGVQRGLTWLNGRQERWSYILRGVERSLLKGQRTRRGVAVRTRPGRENQRRKNCDDGKRDPAHFQYDQSKISLQSNVRCKKIIRRCGEGFLPGRCSFEAQRITPATKIQRQAAGFWNDPLIDLGWIILKTEARVKRKIIIFIYSYDTWRHVAKMFLFLL